MISSKIPSEWSFLYLGGNDKNPSTANNNCFRKVDHMLMTHAVGLDINIYDKAIKTLSNYSEPVDVCYVQMQKKSQSYCLYPYLAWQRSGWSDIEQRFRIYDLDKPSPSLKQLFDWKKFEM